MSLASSLVSSTPPLIFTRNFTLFNVSLLMLNVEQGNRDTSNEVFDLLQIGIQPESVNKVPDVLSKNPNCATRKSLNLIYRSG